MTQQALQLQGIDQATRSAVRVELRLITDESRTELPETFCAPCGFLSQEDIRVAEALTARKAKMANEIEELRKSGFRAPQGFLA